jgi:hypothetical protein
MNQDSMCDDFGRCKEDPFRTFITRNRVGSDLSEQLFIKRMLTWCVIRVKDFYLMVLLF